MEKNTTTKFKWFWGWDDEREEAWLTQMAAGGLHLQKVVFPAVYRFEIGEPRRDVYRLDFISLTGSKYREYLQIFEDSGWEHLGEMSSWQYFRKTVPEGEEAEIFTDAESKIQKYRRMAAWLVVCMLIMIFIATRIHDSDRTYTRWAIYPMVVFIFSGMAGLIQILKRTRELKKL